MSDETTTKAIATVSHGTSMMNDTAKFEHSFRVAKVFAGSQLVPKHLQGKVADVMIALNIADRLNEDPLTVMQSIYIVSGKAGWSTSYMIARINQSGALKGRITWDVAGAGKDLVVTAKGTLADTGEVVTATASMQMAMAEGWTSNKKYQSMPEVMLRYRAAAMLQRLYFPEVMLGMRTVEELEGETPEPTPPRDITPRTATKKLEDFLSTQRAEGQPDPIPDPQIVDSTVPEDGPNVFKRDDPEKVAELLERTAEAEIIDAETGEVFDANEYLDHAIGTLQKMQPEEIVGAHAEVKRVLANHPDQLGTWNSARFKRLAEYADKASANRRGGRAT